MCQNGKSYRADVVDLFPGTFEMVEMQVGNPGTWLLHCHVADHIHAGMETLFTILPRQGKKKACGASGVQSYLGSCAHRNHSVAPRHNQPPWKPRMKFQNLESFRISDGSVDNSSWKEMCSLSGELGTEKNADNWESGSGPLLSKSSPGPLQYSIQSEAIQNFKLGC